MQFKTLAVDTHEQRIFAAANLQAEGYLENHAAATRTTTVMVKERSTVSITVRNG
jgi:hypothetical protein